MQVRPPFGPSGCRRGLILTIEDLPKTAEVRFGEHGVIVRAGRHCAPVALEAVGVPGGTIRISFGPFNGDDDIEPILHAVDACRR